MQTNFPAVRFVAFTRTEFVPAGRCSAAARQRPVPVRIGRRAVQRREYRPGLVERLEPHPAGDLAGAGRVQRALRGHLPAVVDLRVAGEVDRPTSSSSCPANATG